MKFSATGAFQSLFISTLLSLLWVGAANAQWLKASRTLMGTQVSVEIWSEDIVTGRDAIEKVFAEIERLDLMMNPWNVESELARINREAALHPVTTTAEIITVIDKALYYSRLSDGAFDISFASVGQYYDYREGKSPDAKKLASERENIDFRTIELDVADSTIRYTKPGLQIDLGGIAKGYAVDRGIGILQELGIESAVIAAGGDSRILGSMADRPRIIGIRHPRKKNEHAVLMPLVDTAISTSGDYERYFVKDGIRFHHILEPSTGEASRGVQSASVIAAYALDTDALSTTVFVLGVERGLELVNRLEGVDAIVIDGEGKLHYSQELLLSTRP
ncbi:MAG: FAD:protein FMN transferase [Halioglobus sp.]